MKHFTKYLPVDGEIKEGDHVIDPIIAPKQGLEYISGDRFINDMGDEVILPDWKIRFKFVKQKLFLCSRDIEGEEEVYHKELGLVYTGYLSKHSGMMDVKKALEHEEDEEYTINPTDLFKVIGEISPGALSYVKEGDEFDEDEIEGIKSLGGTVGEDGKIDPKSPVIEIYYWYKIKGPCGHFH